MNVDYYGIRVNSEGAQARAAFAVSSSERGVVECARRNGWLDFNLYRRTDSPDGYADNMITRYRNGERAQ